MKPPADHIRLLKLPTTLPSSVAKEFKAEEVKELEKCARWCNHLIDGHIKPYTQAQKHFISVAEGQLPANCEFETLWLRLQAALERFDTHERGKTDRMQGAVQRSNEQRKKRIEKSENKKGVGVYLEKKLQKNTAGRSAPNILESDDPRVKCGACGAPIELCRCG